MLEFLTAKGNEFKTRSIFKQLCYQFTHLCREGNTGKLLILDAFCNSNSILPDILRENIQQCTCGQWSKQVNDRCIKTEACKFCHDIIR